MLAEAILVHGDIGYKFCWLLLSKDQNQGTPVDWAPINRTYTSWARNHIATASCHFFFVLGGFGHCEHVSSFPSIRWFMSLWPYLIIFFSLVISIIATVSCPFFNFRWSQSWWMRPFFPLVLVISIIATTFHSSFKSLDTLSSELHISSYFSLLHHAILKFFLLLCAHYSLLSS